MGRVRMGRAGRAGLGFVLSAVMVAGAGPVVAQDLSAPPGPVAGQATMVTLGADNLVYTDDFSSTDGWGVLDEDDAHIEGADGGLRFRLLADDSSRWTWHTLDAAQTVLRVGIEATLEPGTGSAGPMCGSGGDDPSFFAGVVNNAGEWVLARIVNSVTTVIERDAVPGLDLSQGGTVSIELECAVTGDGGDRIGLFVDGVNVADVTDASSFGPYLDAGLFASVATQPFEVRFDDARVLGGDTYAPVVVDALAPTAAPSAAPQPSGPPSTPLPLGRLLEAVPIGFRGDCRTASADKAAGQLEAVLCVPAGGATTAEYYRYATEADLQAAFDRFLALEGGDPTGTDCTTAPGLVDYTISGRTIGQLACYDAPHKAVAFQWTERDLLVLAFGSLNSGSFADAYAWWQDAGPNP